MNTHQRPQAIAVVLIKQIHEEQLLWLIVSFIQGLMNDD